jgi:mannose/cellobiose epimerase-like protein (N-acyl-D-glucosamine 2-epimerase family)
MVKTLERFRADAGSGWIDMKIDPRNGQERNHALEFYRKDRIYGWIQGRALESLAAHIGWIERKSPPGLPPPSALKAMGEALYTKLFAVCLPFHAKRPRFYFIMDSEGRSLVDDGNDNSATLTHLFALRGLFAYALSRGKSTDLERIGLLLRHAVDEAVQGRCRNDQVLFDPDGQVRRPVPRRGYEGQMIALGACELLYSHWGQKEDLGRADALVNSVLSDFLHRNRAGEPVLVEALDRQGRPLVEGGRVRTNPGHAIEFVGLSLQLYRRARRPFGASSALELLRRIAWACAAAGSAPHGGIYRSIDAEDGSPIDSTCPWWSSFEAARTFAELYLAAGDDAVRLRCARTAVSFIDTIEKAYIGHSNLGIPVQTISAEGEVLPAIPATPDLDSGYHNGIPLIDVLEVIDEAGCLFCGAAEAELPPRRGVPLQGHIARTGKAEDQKDPLKVRACRLAAGGGQALLVSADVLEFSKAWASRMERRLAALCGIENSAVFLFASHTHTAPATIDLGLVKQDRPFLAGLETAMIDAALAASSAMAPVAPLFAQAGLGALGVNRRAPDPTTGKILMRPNPRGPLDDSLASLFFINAQGKPKALLFNMALHPTSLGVSLTSISADYPGLAASLLEKAFGGAIALPLQGACGDLRPNITSPDGAEFAEGRYEDAQRIAATLAQTLHASLAQNLHAAVAQTLQASLAQPAQATQAHPADIPASGIAEGGQARWLDSCAVKTAAKAILLLYSDPPSLAELDELIARCEAQIEEAEPNSLGLAATPQKVSPQRVFPQSSAPMGTQGFATTHGALDTPTAPGFAATHGAPLLEAQSFLAWARRTKRQCFDAQGHYKGPKATQARFGLVSLGEELQLFAIPGELFCSIGMDLKKRALPTKLLVCGYAGGTVGYMPSEEAFAQGGYEVESAYRYYGAPAALSPDTERRIHAIFEALRREVAQ